MDWLSALIGVLLTLLVQLAIIGAIGVVRAYRAHRQQRLLQQHERVLAAIQRDWHRTNAGPQWTRPRRREAELSKECEWRSETA